MQAKSHLEAQEQRRLEEDARQREYLERLRGLAEHRPKQQACLVASTALLVQSQRVGKAASTAARLAKRDATGKAADTVRRNWARRAAFERNTRCLVASWTGCVAGAFRKSRQQALEMQSKEAAVAAEQQSREAVEAAVAKEHAAGDARLDDLQKQHEKSVASLRADFEA